MKIESGSVKLGAARSYSAVTSHESSVSAGLGTFKLFEGYSVGTGSALEGHSANYNGIFRGQRTVKSGSYGLRQTSGSAANSVKETGKKKAKSGKEIQREFLMRLLNRIDELRKRREERLQENGANAALNGTSYGSFGEITQNTVNSWTYVSYSSSTFTEEETTAFTGTGTVKTEDGREISFNISIEMSRRYSEKYEDIMVQTVACTDPLVINYNADAAQMSDMKFFFDLDCDGKEEEISYLKNGSGFLALDKNGDGVINDGSELFGTRSGDGFADLAAYDEDGNGWIDENDSIFDELKVWIRDEYGQNILIPLKRTGAGAICLANESTEFSLNSHEDNRTNGIIRKSGIFLMENGNAGTVQHVDFSA